MDNLGIGRRLRCEHGKIGDSRAIRLPAETQIRFRDEGSRFHIEMTANAVRANMQTNSAGFEGWSLALHLWLGQKPVSLSWSPPPRRNDGSLNLHYARFLYRAHRFASLFDWFDVRSAEHLADCAVHRAGELFLNHPSSNRADRTRPNREAMVEAALVGKHKCAFLKAFGMTEADRQFPVGVFTSAKASKATAVFTGGASAIDITGISPTAFTLFELKTGANIMVGALGELLFYANVMRDAAGPGARFDFCKPKDGQGSRAVGVKSAKAIRAILIAEQFHPLLEHPQLFQTINRAAKRFSASSGVPMTMEGWKLSGFGPELSEVDSGTPAFTPIGNVG